MFKKFPEAAARFAVDGVIAPSALHEATRAMQLERYARKRAAALMSSVPAQVERARNDARLAGYAQGYAEVITQVVPHLAAMLVDTQALRATLRRQVCDALQCSLEQEGVAAELIAQRCEKLMGDADDLVLYLPESDPQLRRVVSERLCAMGAISGISLRSTDGPFPLMQAGERTVELDPAGALLAAVDFAVAAPVLEVEARARARAYVDSFTKSARTPAPEPARKEFF